MVPLRERSVIVSVLLHTVECSLRQMSCRNTQQTIMNYTLSFFLLFFFFWPPQMPNPGILISVSLLHSSSWCSLWRAYIAVETQAENTLFPSSKFVINKYIAKWLFNVRVEQWAALWAVLSELCISFVSASANTNPPAHTRTPKNTCSLPRVLIIHPLPVFLPSVLQEAFFAFV